MGAHRVLRGRYELGEIIGRGGMAVVHVARDAHLNRRIAVKLLHEELAADASSRSRFRREAQAGARLNHPAIVAIHDVGHDDGGPAGAPGALFIVMEHVAGRSLRDLLRDGRPSPSEAVAYLLGVLAALDVSHRAGIVHRDIKPANVMITATGAVKLVDFGIARVDGDGDADGATQTLAVMGTAHYLSPEQVRGEPVDARSDIYSAGCLLYELLTGRPPFTGDNPVAVAFQHVHRPVTPAGIRSPDVTPQLEAVLRTALAKDPADRFPSARAFSEALLAATSPLAPPPLARPAGSRASAALPPAPLTSGA